MNIIPARVAERCATRFVEDDGCHISTYSTGSHGYAQAGWRAADGGRTATTAHRAAFVHGSGSQIPEGMTVDHICRTKRCVRYDHLRLLSNVDNSRRNISDFDLRKSCAKGHDPINMKPRMRRKRSGEKYWALSCHACLAESRRRYKAKMRRLS